MKILARYKAEFSALKERIQKKQSRKGDAHAFQELAYRIGVIETLLMLRKIAPATTDMRRIQAHYALLNDFVSYMQVERIARVPEDKGEQFIRASDACSKIHTEMQKRFGSYRPAGNDAYPADVGDIVRRLLPAWLQMRDVCVAIPTNKQEEGVA